MRFELVYRNIYRNYCIKCWKIKAENMSAKMCWKIEAQNVLEN